jgi:two-component system NtrC family sensor kinase
LIGLHMRDLLAKGNNAGLQPCPFCREGVGEDEFRHPAIDRFYLLSTSRVHGALNEGLQTIHVLRDITERREAQRRYQQLFDNVQEGVFFSTPEGRFLEVNDALVSMLGYSSKDELMSIDIPTQLYVTAEHRSSTHSSMRPTGELRNLEIQFRRKDGTLMPAVVNASSVRSAAGEIVQYRGMIFDMTEVKKFQMQLQRERDFNLQILNNTQNMILVADTAGLISYANRRCSGLEAYGKADLVGNKIAELVEAADRGYWSAAFDQALIGQAVDNLEVQMMLATGANGRFSVNLSPMRDAADAVTSVVVVMTDITEAAMIQAKLMSTEKLAAVGQLVSGVAHEVNNPLTAIMGFADLMLEHPELPDFAKQDLGVIMQEAVRTKEIVQNLLSFARQTPPQRSVVDVNAILRRAIALRAYDLSSHGVQVVENFGPNLPETVADEHQLLQVFLNIINNAYDAVRETGHQGRIELRTYAQDGNLCLDFTDNGPGVSHMEKVFDPFFTTKPVGKGTGLGLSICYGIVRQHGGEVQCRNNANNSGATFTIKLPSRQQAKAAAASAHAEYSQ